MAEDMAKQKEEYANMANQLEDRLEKTMQELNNARKNKTL